jgi:hypothetical protein
VLPEQAIRSVDQLGIIPDIQVRNVARHILVHEHPDRDVTLAYEPEEFFIHRHNRKEGTVPDLLVQLDAGEQYFLEVTQSNLKPYFPSSILPIWLGSTDAVLDENGFVANIPVIDIKDPKGKQKRVMRIAQPDVDYRVLYGKDLDEMFVKDKVDIPKPSGRFRLQVQWLLQHFR